MSEVTPANFPLPPTSHLTRFEQFCSFCSDLVLKIYPPEESSLENSPRVTLLWAISLPYAAGIDFSNPHDRCTTYIYAADDEDDKGGFS